MEKRLAADKILENQTKSDDLKLFEIFEIYKEDIRKDYTQLYYALLGWKDAHLKELTKTKYSINGNSRYNDLNRGDGCE